MGGSETVLSSIGDSGLSSIGDSLMLDPATRQRKSRRRRRRGRVLLRVEVHEFELVTALLKAGRLCETDGLQRPKIEQALAKLVEDWTARWLSRVA